MESAKVGHVDKEIQVDLREGVQVEHQIKNNPVINFLKIKNEPHYHATQDFLKDETNYEALVRILN